MLVTLSAVVGVVVVVVAAAGGRLADAVDALLIFVLYA